MLRCTESLRAGPLCRHALATLMLLYAAVATLPASAAGYIDQIADLPLMDGLDEVADAGVTFDKPSGRIVEAFAHGDVRTTAVRQFYRQTLPQLGWTHAGSDRFAREGEVLTLDYLGENGDLTVRFTLAPQ